MEGVKTVGGNIRRLRDQLGLSQIELADRLQVRQPQVWKWENNKSGLPETPTLFKLAKALKCSVEDLLVGVDVDYDALWKELHDDFDALLNELERLAGRVGLAEHGGVITLTDEERKLFGRDKRQDAVSPQTATTAGRSEEEETRLQAGGFLRMSEVLSKRIGLLSAVDRRIPDDYEFPTRFLPDHAKEAAHLDAWRSLTPEDQELVGGFVERLAGDTGAPVASAKSTLADVNLTPDEFREMTAAPKKRAGKTPKRKQGSSDLAGDGR